MSKSNDRELLEWAAKAAGYRYDDEVSRYHDDRGQIWSPLEDDGDALRLAMKLRLRVCCPTTDTDCALASNGDVTAYSEDDLHDTPMSDLYAATRRAITMAAAKIGKAMR